MIANVFSETGWALLSIQFTGCIVLGLGVSFFYRHSAARAHQILLISLAASVLLPSLYVCVHVLGLGLWEPRADSSAEALMVSPAMVETQAPEQSPIEVDLAATLTLPESTSGLPAEAADTQRGASTVWLPSGRIMLYLGWGLTTMALLGRLALQFLLGWRLLHQSERVTTARLRSAMVSAKLKMGITGSVDMRTSGQVHSPVIWCWRRHPVLLVQRNVEHDASSCDWESVFCHELAHWKRLDHVKGLVAELFTALLPWHPLLWWARHRLLHLSELACDDWVLAAGQSGTQYAESLLNLSAQKQMLFLPAIVGKEHTMKERISRIVKGQVGNPSVSKLWTGFIVALALCMSVGIALAQTRPHPSDPYHDHRADQEAELKEAAIKGRRNVLHRLLDQLHEQLRETEAALFADNDEPGERQHILRSELATLRQQITHIEGQAHQLERRPRERDGGGDEKPSREHLEELAKYAQALEHERATLDDPHSEEAHEIQHALERIQEEMIVAEQRLERQHRDSPEGKADLEDARQELRWWHDGVRWQMRELESDLDLFPESDDRYRYRELRDRFTELSEEERHLDDLEHDLEHRLELEHEKHKHEAERQEIHRHQMKLSDRRTQIERQLHRLEMTGRGEGNEAHELHSTLDSLVENLRDMESQQAEELKSRNIPREPAVSTETRVFKLKHANPMQLASLLERLVTGPRGRLIPDPRSRSVIITDTPENVERCLHIIEQLDVPGDDSDEYTDLYDTFLVPAPQSQDASRSTREVDVLRDQVNELNEEMKKMRVLLEQLAKDRSMADAPQSKY